MPAHRGLLDPAAAIIGYAGSMFLLFALLWIALGVPDRPRAAATRQHRRRARARARWPAVGSGLGVLRDLRDLDAVQSARLGLRAAFHLLTIAYLPGVRGAAACRTPAAGPITSLRCQRITPACAAAQLRLLDDRFSCRSRTADRLSGEKSARPRSAWRRDQPFADVVAREDPRPDGPPSSIAWSRAVCCHEIDLAVRRHRRRRENAVHALLPDSLAGRRRRSRVTAPTSLAM